MAVAGFFASLVAKILRPVSADCAGPAVTAQIAAFFLHSTLLLREDVWKSAAGRNDEANSAHSDGRQVCSSAGDGDGLCETPRCLGLAPVGLLEFCWWMERRLSIAQRSATSEQRIGPHLSVEKTGLLRLLRSVVKHPLLELTLDRAFDERGSTTPPVERLVAFELAVSNVNGSGGASTRLALLESVTIGLLVVDSSSDAGGLRGTRIKRVWKECMEVLFAEPRLREACGALVCRDDTMPSECNEGDELASSTWGIAPHSSWRAAGGTFTDDSEGVQGVLESILQVISKLCSSEAAAASVGETVIPAAGPDDAGSCRRKASLLLKESLALVSGLEVDVPGAALVLMAEMTIPAIGATEGREEAMASLRLMWQEWLCKVRPLAYGAIVRLMRLALMWCGVPSDTKRNEGCPVARMLEDLPLLASEMARVWPRLRRTLQPVIGRPAQTGPYASGGWAFGLSNLHCVGQKLARDLAGGWASSTPDSSARGSVIPSSARPSSSSSGRVPLGPVNNGGSTHGQSRIGDADGQNKDRKESQGAREGFFTVEPSTSAALPCTLAQLVVGILVTASLGSKSSCGGPGPSKRAKTVAGRGADGHGRDTSVYEGGSGTDSSQRFAVPFQLPPTSVWVARFLKPVYGPRTQPPTVSALGVLLSTLVTELGSSRNLSGDGEGNGTGGFHTEACRALGVSLVVAILVRAPSLIGRLAEPPCLTASNSPTTSGSRPGERMGRSLVVLASLKSLLEEKVTEPVPRVWLTVVLSHYIAALLSMSKDRDGDGVALSSGWCAWSEVAAFVHASVRKVSHQELRQLPGTLRLAAKEVDPLLKQYM